MVMVTVMVTVMSGFSVEIPRIFRRFSAGLSTDFLLGFYRHKHELCFAVFKVISADAVKI